MNISSAQHPNELDALNVPDVARTFRRDSLPSAWSLWDSRSGVPSRAPRTRSCLSAPARVPAQRPLPTVAVVIPAYNAAAFIGDTLASVAAQELKPDQIVVVDDGSTDGTPVVAAAAAQRLGLTVEIVSRRNGGASVARNAGIEQLRTELVAFLDADDMLLTHHLALLVGAFARHPELVVCFGDAEEFNARGVVSTSVISKALALPFDSEDDGLRLIRGSAFASLLGGNYIPTSGHVASVQALRLEKGFDETLPTSEDRELLLRLACRGPFAYYPRPVSRKRMHETSLTSTESTLSIVRNGLRALAMFSSKEACRELNTDDAAALRVAMRSAAQGLLYSGSCQGFGSYLAQRDTIRTLTGQPARWVFRDILRAVWYGALKSARGMCESGRSAPWRYGFRFTRRACATST